MKLFTEPQLKESRKLFTEPQLQELRKLFTEPQLQERKLFTEPQLKLDNMLQSKRNSSTKLPQSKLIPLDHHHPLRNGFSYQFKLPVVSVTISTRLLVSLEKSKSLNYNKSKESEMFLTASPELVASLQKWIFSTDSLTTAKN